MNPTCPLVSQVSWIRGSDTRVLSVGSVLFSSDIRYQIGSGNHPGFGPSVWTLQVNCRPMNNVNFLLLASSSRYATSQGRMRGGMNARLTRIQRSATRATSTYSPLDHDGALTATGSRWVRKMVVASGVDLLEDYWQRWTQVTTASATRPSGGQDRELPQRQLRLRMWWRPQNSAPKRRSRPPQQSVSEQPRIRNLVRISRNLSVLFVHKIWIFLNPPPPCRRPLWIVPNLSWNC